MYVFCNCNVIIVINKKKKKETKFFDLKRNQFLECQSKTLKVASKFLSPTLNVQSNLPQKIWGVFVFKFWGLRGLCFQDTPCISLDYVASSLAVYMLGVPNELHDTDPRKIPETEILDPLKIPGIKISYKKIQDLKTSIQI